MSTVPVCGVRFKRGGKIYYFDPASVDVKVGDPVIVETIRGIEFGHVVVGVREVPEETVVAPLRKVLRKATPKDMDQMVENQRREKEAFETCKRKIEEHCLDMDLVQVEYTFDGSKIIFYFTAEGRVDFRELVKDLASIFKTRIELRQIGVRDEAKIVGGLGPCGREFCCKTFMGEFEPVSVRMAKGQNLSLNPSKISGVCGRLMCCLRFETEHYDDAKAMLPSVGSRVVTPEGEGKVVGVNVIKNSISVELDDKTTVEFPAEEVADKAETSPVTE